MEAKISELEDRVRASSAYIEKSPPAIETKGCVGLSTTMNNFTIAVKKGDLICLDGKAVGVVSLAGVIDGDYIAEFDLLGVGRQSCTENTECYISGIEGYQFSIDIMKSNEEIIVLDWRKNSTVTHR